ncbi:WD40-repeat-containing domain protein [Coemansia spiralis]|nr:WD40-repeat-containing domain protein [Coemansia spiralis]
MNNGSQCTDQEQPKPTDTIIGTHHHDESSRLCTNATAELFDENNPRIHRDIVRIIAQYLDTQGFTSTKVTLYDEANVKQQRENNYISDVVRLRAAILDGEWDEVDRICTSAYLKDKKHILYNVYKQQYLELIDDNESQKAFTTLTKHLKPLESQQSFQGEFRDLCYLLTTKSIQDAPAFRNWDGIASSREKLAEYLQNILEFEIVGRENEQQHLKPNRLITMLRQAVAYQIESCQYHSESIPSVPSLLSDYTPVVVPNTEQQSFIGHLGNVKCTEYVGPYGNFVASGSSDNTIRIWDTESAECLATLRGHTSRIWDICVDSMGTTLISASGDCTVKIWDISDLHKPQCTATIATDNIDNSGNPGNSGGDIYSVSLNSLESHIIMAGYDRTIRLYDRTFHGHDLSVAQAVANPLGNLIISGSKDQTIRFWDIISGTCVKSLRSHLGEVTSVATSDSDNSNRLWDLRSLKRLRRYKGHQNTSKNFIRSGFIGDSLVVGGSEDGMVYIWDRESTNAKWNPKRGILCSASDDWMLKTWWFDPHDTLR